MKHSLLPYVLVLASLLAGCHSAPAEEDAGSNEMARAEVQVASPTHGPMASYVELQATSLFLKKNMVSAPLACYVTEVHVRLGDVVQAGTPLFELITKEGRAISGQAPLQDSSLKNLGRLTVRANSSGIITTLEHQQGDYVLEGAPLCTLAQRQDQAFQLNVPYEYSHYLSPGAVCSVRLPDGHNLTAYVRNGLAGANGPAQTQLFLIMPTVPQMVPEGLIATVLLPTASHPNATLLPKGCLLADEELQHYWVMKLLNDSIAVRVDITPGLSDSSRIEVLSPALNPADRFVAVGGYGLADTARIVLAK